MKFPTRLVVSLALAGSLGACDSSAGPGTTGAQVQFSIATRGVPAAAPSMGAEFGPVTFADSTDTLVISQVLMVVREVELKQTYMPTDSTPCASGADGHGSCEELASGPYLLDLPLSIGATTVMSVPVAPGSYSEFEFKVHAPNDDGGTDFLTLHPDLAGVSIRVTGTWNGTPYTYETGLSADQEMHLLPPLVVTDSSSADFTLYIDIGTWFRDTDGKLLDPTTASAGGPNESVVNRSIRESFEAFEDENHDGNGDHGDHQHQDEG